MSTNTKIAPFPIDATLTAVSITYANPDLSLIADMLLPRTPTAYVFKHRSTPLGDAYTPPDSKIGRTSEPTINEYGFSEVDYSCDDYGYDSLIPNIDIELGRSNPGGAYDPLGHAVMMDTKNLLLDRERRVAALVTNAASYAATNKSDLSASTGAQQFSNTNSTPINTIMTAMDGLIVRPNYGFCDRLTFSKLAQHPQILKAVNRSLAGDSGVANKMDIAGIFGLKDIFIGESFVNSAKKGQTASLARTWTKCFGLFYRDRDSGPQNGLTFGYTAQYGTRQSGQQPDTLRGARGSVRTRTFESVKEVISAYELGYLMYNAIA